jgi:soluble lytic murein transglycosylase-like protein
MRKLLIAGLALALAAQDASTAGKPPADRDAYAADVCTLLEQSAAEHNLSLNFFTRLIWRESFFNDQAVSPAGAEGIAQFMPGTAKLRGIKDSFDYKEALPASAAYLAELTTRFGNVGLAAAAYNFGEDGTARWLADARSLPDETEDYVLAITGHAADDWRKTGTALDIPDLAAGGTFAETCAKIVRRELSPELQLVGRSPRKPWGVVIAGGFSERRTLATFARVKSRYAALLAEELPMVVRKRNLSRGRKRVISVMIGRNSRAEAQQLCAHLTKAGAACIVARN